MEPTKKIGRRDFIKGSASALAAISFPGVAFGQTAPGPRLEWEQFKTTSQYASFFNAISAMRANTSSTSRSSWQYWTDVHVNYCPHDTANFLAWHRGYLFYFEQQLRIISGDSSLSLPYWDYYASPRIPSEFTDPASGNPLYVPRPGTNVYNALDLSPFVATVYNFQRGTVNAFEPKIESAPHNPVHNLIGGIMATMQSPIDPIFYLHHGNIDRIMHAWALPDGKGIPYTTSPYSPSTSDPYWAGELTYAPDLTLPKYRTYHPAWLSYDYDTHNKPSSLPPLTETSPIKLVQAQIAPTLNRPPIGEFASSPGRAIAVNKRSLAGVTNVGLAEISVSARISLPAPAAEALQSTLSVANDIARQAPPDANRSVKIVMDKIAVTGLGKNGGYFYNVYINLQESNDLISSRQRHFLGTVGPFEVAGTAHHGSAMLEFPATEVLVNMQIADFREITVSLVRVNGENAPRGQVMRIGEIRVEISTDEPWYSAAPTPRPPGACYC